MMKFASPLAAAFAVLTLSACQTLPTSTPSVTRYPNAGAAVTSKAVEIPGATSLIFVSGNTPVPANPVAAEFSPQYWGDTEAQTASVLKKIGVSLAEMGLTMADVVKVQVFLVAPAPGQLADFTGFGKGFAHSFGAASGGKLPSRTVVTVASLGKPGMLVEIEVTAARPAAPAGPRSAMRAGNMSSARSI
jgi:enamine deaminase RidA (YjgF/YER057c/UK114 family)